MATLFVQRLDRLLRKILVVLPSPRNRLLRLAQKELRHGWLALLQHAITAFGVDVVLKRDLGITRIELERVLLLVNQSRVVTVERPITGIHRQLLLVHSFR